MFIKFLNRQFSKWTGKRSLRTVLIIAFVSQVFAAVGLTGWLSFYNGQQAVDDLASQLRSEMTARIHQHLQTYMAMPHLVNQINVDAIHLGHLELTDIGKLDSYFWHQIQRFNTVSYIGLATLKGEYIGAQIRRDGSIIIEVLDSHSTGNLNTWETNNQGNRTKVSRTMSNYDPLLRPWYQAAVKAGKAVWTDIYVYFSGWSTTISANQPIYDHQGQLLGVATSDLTLLKIGHFLKGLKIGEHSQTFIMDRSGLLVSTSTQEKPYRINPSTEQAEQFLARESADALTRETAHYLMQHFGALSQVNQNQQLDFRMAGKRQFLQIMPYQDQWGLDWLIVVVVPETDFMARINANTRATILLCLVALMVAILIGIVIARWIVQPLQDLNTTAKALAIGEWRQLNEMEREDEIGQLAHVFNRMSQELQVSFNDLEEKVKNRTQDIAAKNLKLTALNEELDQLNQDKNEFLGIVAHDLKNPLAAIQGSALLIQSDYDELPKKDVIEFANIISTSSQQLFELIKNLLDVNQIESGKMRLSLTELNMLPILQFLVKEYREKASVKGIRLICHCTEPKYEVYVDENSIRQVLDNVISNAVKYSPPGKHIIVSISQNENGVRCEIQDEGPGLSEADQQKLFSKFTRLTAQPTGEEHSTGLGLFIVKKLVEAMKGRVWCESELGQGALFILELPSRERGIGRIAKEL
ncbi:MAG: hybrid sensor histidine kinase/response regulator [Candidatus Parabeggiatoa sp. nov. 3]|nr:MAG: hybrid sensor histidine kinase/response regulator [Gammaproteobacteria bacterium]RKZ65201.1 MAG: hybrid sensor histidine kinase/response regulator [Gammaproteobacteria bacterium]RKZ82903.1 MAG: hybrid sensor histidine kinase/response regulator [Gammaproteobacteria bacterium]